MLGSQVLMVWLGVGILLFVLALIGYYRAAVYKTELSGPLKKERRVRLKANRRIALGISHTFLAVSVLTVGATLIVQSNGKYDFRNLDKQTDIQVKDDKDYGAGHTEEPVHYEMKIPTSGKHNPHDLKFGFYTEKPPYEKLVHNLEHGDIIIYYHPNARPEIINSLKELVHYKKAGSGILAVPNDDVPAEDEALVTAWTKTMELPQYDEAKVDTFITRYIDHGPEHIPSEVRQDGGTM